MNRKFSDTLPTSGEVRAMMAAGLIDPVLNPRKIYWDEIQNAAARGLKTCEFRYPFNVEPDSPFWKVLTDRHYIVTFTQRAGENLVSFVVANISWE
jgi:hypothetical protein